MLAHRLRNLARTEPFRLATGAGALFACRVSGAVLGYITLILLARWMGAAELGVYVLAYSWCITLTMVATLGYPGTSFRFIGLGLTSGDFRLIRGFIRRGRQIMIAMGAIVAGAGTAIIVSTGDLIAPEARTPFLIAFACIPVFTLVRFNSMISHAFSWFALAITPNALLRPLLLVIGITLLSFAGINLSASIVLWLFMASLVAIAIAQHAILSARLGREVGNAQPTYQTTRWIRTGLPLLLINAFAAFFPEVSITIAGVYLPAEDLAKMNAGTRTAFLIAFGLDAVDKIISPRASRLFAQGYNRELQRVVTGATRLQFWSALVAVATFIIFGKAILGLFGEDFRDGFGVLIIFSIALLVRAGFGPVSLLLSVSGHQNRFIPVYACALPLHLLLTALLIPPLGINGAAMAMLATTIFWTAWLHVVVVRHIGVQPSIVAGVGYRHQNKS